MIDAREESPADPERRERPHTGGVSAARQRERLIEAVAECMARYGYREMTVAHVLAAAGVSRETFYENFETKLEAVLVAHEAVFEPFFASLNQACEEAADWPAGVTTAIGAALDYASDQPDRAQLLTVEAVTLNAEVAQQVLDSTNRLAELLSGGRRLNAATLPLLTEKALVGGIAAVVNSHLIRGEAAQLPQLKRELAEFTLLPFLGPELASEIASERS
jgi:AcrR family transcriptional regulator